MSKKIPVIVMNDDVVFPGSVHELAFKRVDNINACKLVGEGGDVLLAFTKDKLSKKTDRKSLADVGVLGKIKSKISETIGENGSVSEIVVEVSCISRCKLDNVSHDGDGDERVLMGTYKRIRSRMLRDVSKKMAITVSSKTHGKFMTKILKDSGGSLEQMIDSMASTWPKEQQGMYTFKLRLLTEPDLIQRLQMIMDVDFDTSQDVWGNKDWDMKGERRTVEEKVDKNISKKVSENIARQQKEFYLREKMKIIKEELGDSSSKEVELKRIKHKLKHGRYPAHVARKAKEEIQRFEMCSSYSNEATIIRSYLDWILNLPWLYLSQDEMDLNKVKETLDKSHYGLDNIKRRIIEFLAVKKKSSKESGTIICLVGPPGVGKTSLAKSIAEALNKKFVKISLGGLYDESELRGHRRTYVASMPGKIIRALRQAKVKNPVFLLDEVDKIAVGYHGDPVHALLEILDPKQNTNFNDHYIEEDFDLSKVMFIATANYDDNIPDPLWDRMEIINLRTYTEQEKLNIAKSHLITDVLNNCGLTNDDLQFTDEALIYIIQRYTREAGVRGLRRRIEKIVRKVVTDMIMENKEVKLIEIPQVKEYLDYELYDITQKEDDNLPGVVNGMAYTEFGGDLLPLEVNYFAGKGNLSLTGNLRDTMKESAAVALAFVRANEEQFGLKEKSLDWNNIDVNLHVPAGGVSKDGPSAGVTITTAMISSFSGKPVSSKVAMTGEITLRGKVLPIGGLKEKIISAVRGGVEVIFYPEENSKHLSDVPDDVKQKIKLVPVKHYYDIYNQLF